MLRHVNALGVTGAISLVILGLLVFAAGAFEPVRAADIDHGLFNVTTSAEARRFYKW